MASITTGLRIKLLKAKIKNRGLWNTLYNYSYYVRQFFSHVTIRKFFNILASKAQKRLRISKVIGMPYRYYIDPLNICNLRCQLCPTGLGILGRDKGRMTIENFQKIIDQIVPYALSIELYNWGEPYLHPQIFDMIHYASSRKIAVGISSNMNHFNREMARKTVQSGLDTISISVDGYTQESYSKYRRGGNLAKVIENIKLLVDEKNKAKSPTPYITLRMLINRYNETEIDSLRSLAMELKVNSFSTSPIFIDTTDEEQRKEWLPDQDQYSYYDKSKAKIENVWHCSDLWESVTINWDGGLAPCCWLHQKNHDYENAFARPLKEIWNGEAYVSSRLVFAPGGPKKGPTQTICTKCKGRPLYLKD